MKIKFNLFFVFFLVLLLPNALSSSESSGIDEWLMYGRNLNQSSYYPGTINITSLNNIWNFTANDTFSSSPVIFDNKVFIENRNGYLYALNLNNGNLVWSFGTSGIESTPTISQGKIYFGDYDEIFYCLNSSNGYVFWNVTFGNGAYDISTPAAILDGKIYVGSLAAGSFYVLNATDGSQLWNFSFGQNRNSPAISDDLVYFGASSYVFALNTSGSQVWNYSTNSTVFTSPLVIDGTVYVGSGWNKLFALNSTTGNQIWNYDVGDDVRSSPAFYDGKIFFGSRNNKIFALNTSGSQVWNYSVGGSVFSSPAVTKNGIVFVGCNDNKLYGLNASTGNKLWEYIVGGGVDYLSPAIADEKLVFASDKVYVFGRSVIAPIITNVIDYPDPVYINEKDIGISGFAINGTISPGTNPIDKIFLRLYKTGSLISTREWGLLVNQTNGTWSDIILYNGTWGAGIIDYNLTVNDTTGISSSAFGNITVIIVPTPEPSPDHGYGIYGLMNDVGIGTYFLVSLITSPLFYLLILIILMAIILMIGMAVGKYISKFK